MFLRSTCRMKLSTKDCTEGTCKIQWPSVITWFGYTKLSNFLKYQFLLRSIQETIEPLPDAQSSLPAVRAVLQRSDQLVI